MIGIMIKKIRYGIICTESSELTSVVSVYTRFNNIVASMATLYFEIKYVDAALAIIKKIETAFVVNLWAISEYTVIKRDSPKIK